MSFMASEILNHPFDLSPLPLPMPEPHLLESLKAKATPGEWLQTKTTKRTKKMALCFVHVC